jgi:threonine/homoserine/homoserine lactone efflux protein
VTILHNILLGISLAAPLGPCGVAVIQNGLRHGFARAFVTGVGVTMADATFLLVVFFGLSHFLESTIVKVTILCFGAVVLVYFGYRSIRGARSPFDLEGEYVATARNPFLVGYLVNASNPISVVWWSGVFGSLLSETIGNTSRLMALAYSSTILIGILLWHASMSILTHWGRRFVNERVARFVSVFAGLALVVFGTRFGYNGLILALGR